MNFQTNPICAFRYASAAFVFVAVFCTSLLLIPSYPVYGQGAKIRVALFIDNGTEASEFTKEFRRTDDEDVAYKRVNGDDIRNGVLRNFDAVVIPGGSASEESASLGAEAREEIRRFVKEGGIYLGVCAGAYLASRQREHDLGLLPLTTLDSAHWYRVDDGTMVDVELTAAGMELFGITKRNIRLIYENGPVFAPPIERPDPSFSPLGFFRSEVVADGGKPGVMIGAPAIILSKYGRGSVLVLSPHPEETPGLKQVEVHAIHWLYDHRAQSVATVGATNQKNTNGLSSTRSVQPQPEQHQSINCSTAERRQEPSVDSKLSEQALKLAQSIFDGASDVQYSHRQAPASRQVITAADGTIAARTDCSGFVSYIVHAIAPRHYQVVRSREPQSSYPQAKIWARFFDTLDNDHPQDGWLGIRRWQDLRPGDFIAWVEGNSESTNTGHVMIVAGRPSDLKQENDIRYIEIQVIDSSTVYHFAPEHLPPNADQKHRDGLGTGYVRIILSETGAPIGYWAGTYWGEGRKQINGPTLSKAVRFARMMPLQQVNDGGHSR